MSKKRSDWVTDRVVSGDDGEEARRREVRTRPRERERERFEADVREGLSCVGASNLIVTVPEGIFKGRRGVKRGEEVCF